LEKASPSPLLNATIPSIQFGLVEYIIRIIASKFYNIKIVSYEYSVKNPFSRLTLSIFVNII